MSTIDILLIIICAAGLIHGLMLSVYIIFIKNKRALTDILLVVLLILMAFRIGKSIVFQFNNELEFLFIFLGLSTLLLIGPVLNWYVKSIITPNFRLTNNYYIQVIPFLLVLGLSPYLSEQWFIENGKHWAYIILISIYLHLAFYIYFSFKKIHRFNQSISKTERTKSQEHLLICLKYVIAGIAIIWISYVLNIFESNIPYILGPILYSVCIYLLTYKAYKLKITEIDSKSIESTTENTHIYKQLVDLMVNKDLYLSSDLSLSELGKSIGFSSHKISSSINEFSKMNFNNFINQYRVQKAKSIFNDEKSNNFTISSIAYDSGFSSISSFNTAFKKFEKTTPSVYRNSLNK